MKFGILKLFLKLRNHATNEPESCTTVGEVTAIMGKRSLEILVIILAIPMAIPIPHPPGFSSILAIPILFLLAQIPLKSTKPYLPFVSEIKFKKKILAFLIKKSQKLLIKVFKFSKRRNGFFTTPHGKIITCISNIFATIFLFLPLPGVTFPCAVAIVISNIGMLLDDNKLVEIGVLFGLIGSVLTISSLIFAKKLMMIFV